MRKLLSIAILGTCSFVSFGQEQVPSFPMLDSFILKVMNDWHTMGVSIAVVKKDSIMLAKGYGYRDFANKLAVTENTIFPIASCSKTFASALMGMASDERKIDLNKPVHQYLSQFQLYSGELTKQATIRDLLSHSTGLPGHDWAWTFDTNYPEDVYLKRIRYLQPSVALRTKYQYNNFMFFVLAVLAQKVYNKKWNELVAEKFFHPLEMYNSYASSAVLKDPGKMSLTYQYRDSFLLEKTRQMDDLLAAGALLSTSKDLAHWLQMWVNAGMYKEHRILSAEYARKAITPEIVVARELTPESIDEPIMNMGLGWFLSTYRGHYKAHHTGNVAGYSSSITFFPFDSLGIVVLTNQNSSPLIRLIPSFIADIFFGLDIHDKNSVLLEQKKKFEASRKHNTTISADTISKRPLLPFSNYCGQFSNPGYGSVKVTPYHNSLLLSYVDLELVLIPKGSGHGFSSHYLEDSVISTWGVGDVIFKSDKTGGVTSFTIPFEPDVKDIIFSREK